MTARQADPAGAYGVPEYPAKLEPACGGRMREAERFPLRTDPSPSCRGLEETVRVDLLAPVGGGFPLVKVMR